MKKSKLEETRTKLCILTFSLDVERYSE